MKSDREFIDGIYAKAAAIRAAEKPGESALQAGSSEKDGQPSAGLRRGAVAFAVLAACLALLVRFYPMPFIGEEAETPQPRTQAEDPKVSAQPFGLPAEDEGAGTPSPRTFSTQFRIVAVVLEVKEEEGATVVLYEVKEGVEGIVEDGEEIRITIPQEELELYYPDGVKTGSVQALSVYEKENGLALSSAEEMPDGE